MIRRLFVLLLLMLASQPLAAQTFPKLTGRVVDAANLLDPAQEAALTQKLDALEQQSGRQLVVATLPSLEGRTIEDYGYRLGREWGIGSKEEDDGVLLIVAPNERKVRIETGYGARVFLTDALSSIIIRNAITPRFKAGDFPGGIDAGVDAISEQMRLPPAEAAKRAAGGRGGRGDEPAVERRRRRHSARLLGAGDRLRLPELRAACVRAANIAASGGGAGGSIPMVVLWGLDAHQPCFARRRRRRWLWRIRWRRRWRRRRLFGRRRQLRRRRSVGLMVTLSLQPDDHRKVSEAIAAAEAASDGEILTIVSADSDSYHDVALHWAVAAMIGVLALSAWQAARLASLWEAVIRLGRNGKRGRSPVRGDGAGGARFPADAADPQAARGSGGADSRRDQGAPGPPPRHCLVQGGRRTPHRSAAPRC